MAIHDYDLKLTAYLQERGSLSLERCAAYLGKSLSSVKRSIAAVNGKLPASRQIQVEENLVYFQMSYLEYLQFLNELTLEDYLPSQEERIGIMAIYLFFNGILNRTHLYEDLRFSLSTKKKDSHALHSWLEERGLEAVVVPKEGIRVCGNELLFRMSVCEMLCHYLDVGEDGQLIPRRANNPLQSMMADYFLAIAYQEIDEAVALVQEYQERLHCRVSYISLRFLLVYLSCALYRVRIGMELTALPALSLPVTDLGVMPQPMENIFLNRLVSALDIVPYLLPPDDAELQRITDELVRTVQSHIVTWIRDDHRIYQEVYAFLHRCTIRNLSHFAFYDNKLEETRQHYHFLYGVLQAALSGYEQTCGAAVTPAQLSTLTLIFRKYVTRNKLAGRNRKRLVVVSNSSVEKIEFFMEKLLLRLDAELVDLVSINELYRLNQLEYDHLIVFSNRIEMLLRENGYPCIKLNFYLTEEDYTYLAQHGFSTSHRKLKSESFLAELDDIPREDRPRYLLTRYPEYFLE